jgi:hypothetical protein
LDFDLHPDPTPIFHRLSESSYFEGRDEWGTFGKTMSFGSAYDPLTRLCAGVSHMELTTAEGETIVIPRVWHKHIPSQAQVEGWLRDAGLEIEKSYRNFGQEPLKKPETEPVRATIWALKP